MQTPVSVSRVHTTTSSSAEAEFHIAVIYDLTMKTYLPEKNLTFDGQVEISLVVVEPTKSIVLNSRNITVIKDQCEVFSEDNKKLDIEKVLEQERLEKVEFVLKNGLEKDQKIRLKVKYTGFAATTHMEPSDARRMVPCLDEPEYKANWTVTMIHPKGTTAVSNGIEDGKP
ncbi:hypothetical protein OSTOST_07911, partial [Ostertagia ostertagi]